MEKKSRIYVAGSKGMVGSSVLRLLKQEGYSNIIETDRLALDLRDQLKCKMFFEDQKPEYVILAAARVGGINANLSFPAEFIHDNLTIQTNIIHQSYLNNVKQLVFLGSSCIYPRECKQPMKEEYLLTGKLESTNEAYAIAKIAGLKMTQFYNKQYGMNVLNLMPCNLYGPNDCFDLEKSHVLSAFVKRFYDAVINNSKEVVLWGTGAAKREFMHVDDLSRAILYFMKQENSSEIINIGTGSDLSIIELAKLIADKVGFRGTIAWDSSKPDGTLRKCLDITKMKQLGFNPIISLEEGIMQMINIYKQMNLNDNVQ